MKKMLFSLIVISMLGTGTAFAQRRSSHNVQGGHSEVVRTEIHGNYGHRGPVRHEYVHHRPSISVYHCPPRPVYHERVIVTPAPVAYSYPCPPPTAPVVVVEPTPVPAAISIGALAGALIGGTIAAATCR